MLGRSDIIPDARPYIVVICSEAIERKVQDFVDDQLVKSPYRAGENDESIPLIKVLAVGHPITLRASTSDVQVRCGGVGDPHDRTKTFCGTPIRLCDGAGNSRNATLGGIVKVTSTGGEYQLYGLTAGHMIRDRQIVTEEDDNLVGMDPIDESMEPAISRIGRAFPIRSNPPSKDFNEWCGSDEYSIGRLLNEERTKTREASAADGEQIQKRPYLDWALFEFNAHRPNQLTIDSREYSRDDLRLPPPGNDASKDEILVSIICTSQEPKRGMLSMTRARVLLDPGDTFTDAYTLSLEGSNSKRYHRWIRFTITKVLILYTQLVTVIPAPGSWMNRVLKYMATSLQMMSLETFMSYL